MGFHGEFSRRVRWEATSSTSVDAGKIAAVVLLIGLWGWVAWTSAYVTFSTPLSCCELASMQTPGVDHPGYKSPDCDHCDLSQNETGRGGEGRVEAQGVLFCQKASSDLSRSQWHHDGLQRRSSAGRRRLNVRQRHNSEACEGEGVGRAGTCSGLSVYFKHAWPYWEVSLTFKHWLHHFQSWSSADRWRFNQLWPCYKINILKPFFHVYILCFNLVFVHSWRLRLGVTSIISFILLTGLTCI